MYNHPEDQETAIASHSLGTLVLWHLLFTKDLPENDPAYEFRKLFNSSKSKYKLRGLTAVFDQIHHNKGRRAQPRNGFYILICGGFESKLLYDNGITLSHAASIYRLEKLHGLFLNIY